MLQEVQNMFIRSPMFIRMQNYGQRLVGNDARGMWWLLLTPGVVLTLVALAILAWPELLAYMVASVLLFAGVTLMAWSWRMRRVEQRMQQHTTMTDHRNW
jgi:Flp pilus assembly protein TadB